MDNNYIVGASKTLSVLSTGLAPRESELTRVLSKLHGESEFSIKLFDELCNKISPVLRNNIQKELDESVNLEFSSSLAQELNGIVGKLILLNQYIVSVKERVEL